MKAIIEVRLKKGILDPQGKAVNNALHHLGFVSMKDVRIGKLIEMNIEDGNREQVIKSIQEACRKLLTNPVVEDYNYRLIED